MSSLLVRLALSLLVVFGLNSSLKAETVEQVQASSQVTDVILYRSQATVTRVVPVSGEAGSLEVLITDLPENIVGNSLFAEGNENVEVRAVQFRTRAVQNSPREEVRKLSEELESITASIALNQRNTKMVSNQSKYLDKLENFVAPTATTELSKGVLDAKELRELTLFNFEQRKELVKQQTELASELKQLQSRQNLIQRKLNEITNRNTRSQREAVIFLQKNDDAKQSIRLNYLVNNCGWSPSYAARAKENTNAVRLEYNGLLRQMTGEDWSNVNLTLSSASPALSAAGPGLAPFQVTLDFKQDGNAPAQQVQQAQSFANTKSLQSLRVQQQRYNEAFQNSFKLGDNLKNNWSINDTINKITCAELTADASLINASQNPLTGNVEQPAMNYKIANPVSITSRNTQQMVRIMATELESDFYHVATPILTSYVYREAAMKNSSQQDLLGGPITVYLDDRFVGRSEIPSVARGQMFVVGFGADAQLRTRRELVDKDNSFTGGNVETRMTYRLVIENYKDSVVKVRLIDRMPVVGDDSNIRITMLPADDGNALSKDETYLRLEKSKGILRWDTEITPRSVGKDAAEFEYGFTIEHDRQYQVALPANMQKQQREFEEMQLFRNRRLP